MVQVITEVGIVGLLAGLVGIIWMMVRSSFDGAHSPDDKREEERELRRFLERTHEAPNDARTGNHGVTKN